jgi:hypothetical protein
MPTFYFSILRIPQMIWVWRAIEECYWQGKIEELGEKPVSVPLCPSQILHGLTRARTQASAVTVQRLTTWAMARPMLYTYDAVKNVTSMKERFLRQISAFPLPCSSCFATIWLIVKLPESSGKWITSLTCQHRSTMTVLLVYHLTPATVWN